MPPVWPTVAGPCALAAGDVVCAKKCKGVTANNATKTYLVHQDILWCGFRMRLVHTRNHVGICSTKEFIQNSALGHFQSKCPDPAVGRVANGNTRKGPGGNTSVFIRRKAVSGNNLKIISNSRMLGWRNLRDPVRQSPRIHRYKDSFSSCRFFSSAYRHVRAES